MEQITAILENLWAWAQAHPAIVTNGLAGAVLGPFLSKLLRGGLGVGTLGGLIGGVAGGFGADQAGLADLIAAGEDPNMLMTYLQNIAEGAVGGGVLGGGGGAAAGLMSKKK